MIHLVELSKHSVAPVAAVSLWCACLFAGCGAAASSTSSASDRLSTSAVSRAKQLHKARLGSTSERALGLTAIGAPRSVWAHNQIPDTTFAPGSVYDPASHLGDGASAVYTALDTVSGRIESFDHNFSNGTSLSAARIVLASQDLPVDARRVWFKNLSGQCAIEEYRSADLRRDHLPPAVNVEYTSDSAGTSFTSTSVNDATLVLIAPGPPIGLSC